MHVITVRNVAEALPAGIHYLLTHGETIDTRAGKAYTAIQPVTTVYERPRERVVFTDVRDANPFFHLAESLWMLDGRDDDELLNRYVRDFGQRYAEEGGTIHGAYGYRWRKAFGFDQLGVITNMLQHDTASRQAVLAMWDPTVKTPNGQADLTGGWKDRPCNTHAYFRVWHNMDGPLLDMTVCCRSNDLIWGAYGANAVHFSILQEYLAARIGVQVGQYYQVSNNYHMYVSAYDTLMGRVPPGGELINRLSDQRYPRLAPHKLVCNAESFLAETRLVLDSYMKTDLDDFVFQLENNWLSATAWPVLQAHKAYKDGRPDEALGWSGVIHSPDWREACTEWLKRRVDRAA